MDREKLFRHLEQRYISKRDMLSRIPLGMEPEALWQELLNRRRAKGTVLPLYGRTGSPYWYNTTDRMVAASEKIVEALLENETELDPYVEAPTVSTLEEVFYTSYVEGAQITMQAAMDFLSGGQPPRDIEEQLITNNRLAGNYAGANLYRPIDGGLLGELAYILTDGIDGGGQHYRTTDDVDYPPAEGEHLSFPPALMIPNRINELTAFLASPQTHPLIKAGAAQAYMMALRPFPEGNERLGRLLSGMILLRAGYVFFSEVSLSALIARKSYGYYEAIANILRDENGGDMTYFMEYFLEVLSRAVDERRLRQTRKEEQARQAEQELARTALVPSPPPPPDDPPKGGDRPSESSAPVDLLSIDMESGPFDDTRHTLVHYAKGPGRIINQISALLLRRMDMGQLEFSTIEIASALNVKAQRLSSCIRTLKDRGAIEDVDKDSPYRYYRLRTRDMSKDEADPQPDGPKTKECPPSLLDRINELLGSHSTKDKRIGTLLFGNMNKGEITLEDYTAAGESSKWAVDMLLASQLGLVERITAKRYAILKEPNVNPSALRRWQKKIISKMYDLVGDDVFSAETIIATLDYSNNHIVACLHQFTLLRILNCEKGNTYKYQFLINPEENPEYFDVAS